MNPIESPKLSVLLNLLKRKLAKLQTDQSERARRNALKALSTVLRRMRARALEEYPPPPRKVRKVKRRKAEGEWARRKPVSSADASKLQAARVPVLIQPSGVACAPVWAAQLAKAGVSISKIREANKSVATRRALLAEQALLADALSNGER